MEELTNNEEYRHVRILLDEEQQRELLPAERLQEWQGKKLIFFGSKGEFGQLVALAVFSVSVVHGEEMELEYIEVAMECQGEGLAQQLLDFCASSFKNSGIRSIYVKCVASMDKVAGWYDFFRKGKFMPVLCCGHQLTYDVGDLRTCELMRYGTDLIGVFGAKLRKYETHLDTLVKQFLQQHKGFLIRQGAYDPQYSRICWDEDQVKGVVCLKQMDEKTVVMTGCCVETDGNGKYLYAALLYSALRELCAVVDDDVRFVLQLYRPVYYALVKKMLGEPGRDLIVQEYVRKLA